MNEIRFDKIYPIVMNRKHFRKIKQNGHYVERMLDACVYFIEANFEVDGDFRVISAEEVYSGKLPHKLLWKTALDNLFPIIRERWDEKHEYVQFTADPMQFGAAAMLHPGIHRHLREEFGDSYIILPYSSKEITMVPNFDPEGFLKGYRNEIKECPQKWGLSENIYIVEKGVITVYPEVVEEEVVPVFTESKTDRRNKYGAA